MSSTALPEAAQRSRGRALLKWIALVLLLLLLTRWTVEQSQNAVHRHERAGDFRANIWQPARDVFHNRNPYPSPHSPAVQGAVPGYPPLTFLTFAPIAALPFVPAAYVWGLLMIAVSLAAIAAVRVRDPICYLLVLLSMPVVGAVWWGNPTPLIVLAAALAWRWRDHPWLGPVAVAVGFAIKFVSWPLFIWFLLTGRSRSALRAALLSVALVLLPWAAIGFHGARDYPALLRALSNVGARKGSFLQAAILRMGGSTSLALAIGLAAAAVLLLIAAYLGGDHRIFSIALIAGLASSPIVWIFYFGVIAVIVGIVRPTFSKAWLLVPALWFGHMMYFPPSPLMLCATNVIAAITALWVLGSSSSPARPTDSPYLILR